jgi:hypothetical protein
VTQRPVQAGERQRKRGSGTEKDDEGGYGSASEEVTKVKQSGGVRGVVDPTTAEPSTPARIAEQMGSAKV